MTKDTRSNNIRTIILGKKKFDKFSFQSTRYLFIDEL